MFISKIFSGTDREKVEENLNRFLSTITLNNNRELVEIKQSSSSGKSPEGVERSLLDITVIYKSGM